MKTLLIGLSLFWAGNVCAQLAEPPLVASPFQLYGDHTFIKLKIDGSEPLDFIFDTGDGLTVIDMDVALKLNLPMDHSKKKASAHGTVEGVLIAHNYIEMDRVRLEDDITVYATSLLHLEQSIGRNIDGIIGYDLLQHYVVQLDEINKSIKLYKQDTYKYGGLGEGLDMTLEKYIPTVNATVQINDYDFLTERFFVITGAATTLDFNTRFSEKNDLLQQTGDHYSYLIKGLGNQEFVQYEGRIRQVRIGKLKFDKLPVGISTSKEGVHANKKVAGIIGNRLLKNFIVTFDYSRKKLYLEKYTGTQMDFHVNACGLEVQMDEGLQKVLVHRVYERGPAKAADVQVNDVLISVNGKGVDTLTLPEINAILNAEGTTVDLVLLREGKEIQVSLDLEEII